MNKRTIVIQTATSFALWSVFTVGASEAKGDAPPADTHATAIYAADPSHLWNRLHHAFFVRPDAGKDAPGADAVDPPLWPDTSGFLKSGATLRAAIAVLDEFLSGDGQALVRDPLKRAVLQHDLWFVFDWSAAFESDERVSEPNLATLRWRLASIIGQLALTGDEIASLPDNLADAVEAGAFSPGYEPEHPRTPFLPPSLLDPAGPWVCVRGALPGPVAPVHLQYYKGSSPFLVFLRLPEGRQATLNYLRILNKTTSEAVTHEAGALPQFPVGTMVALLRQMAVIDTSGQVRLTPLTQTLQMRVYRQVGSKVNDHENSQAAVKFCLKRRQLFGDRNGGLEPVDWSEPLRVSLLHRTDVYDRTSGQSGIKTLMQSCVACHSCGGATIHSVFTYKQDDWVPRANLMAANRLRLIPTTAETETQNAITWKMERYDWGLLKGLLDRRLAGHIRSSLPQPN